MAIQDKAVLVDWSVGMWGANKTDKESSRRITAQKHSAEDAGKWVKILAPDDWLKKQRGVKAKATQLQDKYTVPWLRNGQAILPNLAFNKYDPAMTACRIEWYDVLHSHTMPEYQRLLDNAPTRMGDDYNPRDFPTMGQMERKFYFEYTILPVPDVDSWLTHLVNGDDARLKAELNQRISEMTKEISRELWKKLYAPIAKMIEKLDGYTPGQREGSFKDSLVENVAEIVELLPVLNIGEDGELERMVLEVKRKLTRFSADDLRRDEDVRGIVLAKAKEIRQKMTGYVGDPDDND